MSRAGKRRVSFTPETKNPPSTEKCAFCRHRNIIPQILEMDLCMICFELVCSECRNDSSVCIDCIVDMQKASKGYQKRSIDLQRENE